jgi:hypothetical protein
MAHRASVFAVLSTPSKIAPNNSTSKTVAFNMVLISAHGSAACPGSTLMAVSTIVMNLVVYTNIFSSKSCGMIVRPRTLIFHLFPLHSSFFSRVAWSISSRVWRWSLPSVLTLPNGERSSSDISWRILSHSLWRLVPVVMTA